ncbi:hypothetical protein [Paenibacillus xerothermodurans]|uniref:Uncharacterized protein n=1 Tax=Paenibacillus xerothermodurans TaxID=1977292 RepID=A0A2W1NMU1_PAEXE|nr:hypothetical protein [Paenibacillus xerothermodurans]PZE20785.1 hypothetical protein CBW46_011535 [Paenibacillus xerothermodurans]
MILYQMAKRMERRKELQRSIEQSGGGLEHLRTQKELVEEQLITQANRWSEEGYDEFMLAALTPEVEGTQYSHRWL